MKDWIRPDTTLAARTHRAGLASRWIRPGTRLLDLGDERTLIEPLLPAGTDYLVSTVVRRDDASHRIHFDGKIAPEPQADIALVLGLLEYTDEPAQALSRIRSFSPELILSYNYTYLSEERDRPKLFWASHLSLVELESLLRSSGWTLRQSRHVKFGEILLHLAV